MSKLKPVLLILALALLVSIVALRASGGKDDPARPILSLSTPAPTATPLPEHLSLVMTAGELDALDPTGVLTLDLSGSRCYEAIERFIAAHPEVSVYYQILLDGEGEPLSLEPGVRKLTIENGSYLPSLIENAPYLTKLESLSISDGLASPEALLALEAVFPSLQIDYSVTVLDGRYPYTAESIDLSAMSAEELDRAIGELKALPHLKSVTLLSAEGESTLSIADTSRLSAALPGVAIDYAFELFGQRVSTADERLEFVDVPIGNEGVAELREALPFMSKLNYLLLDSCTIDNEVLAELRDDFPAIKVVWRVFFGDYNCLTDTEMIWATGGTVNDTTSQVLKYCTEVKYMDLGHSLMTKTDFLHYMPKLEVAIFAITWVTDITPIADCKNLEYLELFSTRVTDFSPLAQCTHLKHLNISHSVDKNNLTVPSTDISPLYELPELERFYCTMCYVPEAQKAKMIELHPDCEIEFGWIDPAEGAWRFQVDANGNPLRDEHGEFIYNERYTLLREQFNYDSLQQSGKVWSLY